MIEKLLPLIEWVVKQLPNFLGLLVALILQFLILQDILARNLALTDRLLACVPK